LLTAVTDRRLRLRLRLRDRARPSIPTPRARINPARDFGLEIVPIWRPFGRIDARRQRGTVFWVGMIFAYFE
jgi:hypothetical protein